MLGVLGAIRLAIGSAVPTLLKSFAFKLLANLIKNPAIAGFL